MYAALEYFDKNENNIWMSIITAINTLKYFPAYATENTTRYTNQIVKEMAFKILNLWECIGPDILLDNKTYT